MNASKAPDPPPDPSSDNSNEAQAESPTQSPAQTFETFKRLGPAGPLAVLACVAPALGGFLLLGFLGVVGSWLQPMGAAGVALYITAFAVLSGLALLPTYAQAALGGWTFGVAMGLPAAMLGYTFGAIIGYSVARRAAAGSVMEMIGDKPKWLAVHEALLGGGRWRTLGLVTLIRIPVNSPFALTNLVLGATRVPILSCVVGTLVGMAPRTAVAVFLGAGVTGQFSLGAIKEGAPRWIFFAGIATMILVVVVIGKIANKALAKLTAPEQAQDDFDRLDHADQDAEKRTSQRRE